MKASGSSRSTIPAPIEVAGVPVHPITLVETLDFIDATIASKSTATLFYVNAHGANLAAQDPAFRALLWAADLVFCDGKSIQWAARLLGKNVPERYTPPDWIDLLCALCDRRGYGLFFLGGEPGVAELAAKRLKETYPNLRIDCYHGYFQKDGPENEEVIELVNASGAQVVCVGFGMPLQETWARDNISRLTANVVMTVGAMFDYVAGRTYRAPRWLTDNGLEWLVRLLVEPRRLGRRYVIGNPMFVWRVLKQRLGI